MAVLAGSPPKYRRRRRAVWTRVWTIIWQPTWCNAPRTPSNRPDATDRPGARLPRVTALEGVTQLKRRMWPASLP